MILTILKNIEVKATEVQISHIGKTITKIFKIII
jgi:hypothetical protein